MIPYSEIPLSTELRERLDEFGKRVDGFRAEGPLDQVAIAKLEEHFKASHIYHSAGIEGNRLTLQETVVVLKDGVDISGKPLKDSLEVRNLSVAFDSLRELSQRYEPLRESDIRSLHALIINDPQFAPGEYRRTGVIISGAEHRPPEPLDVSPRMGSLVAWVNENIAIADPIVLATVAHHELAAIHPFLDGNGRVARLLMNLVLLKRGFPISNIKREERPAYYDALSFADVGIYEAIVDIVLRRCSELFAEYERIRAETKRMSEWASRWGTREAEVLVRREAREMELWQSRVRQIFLEFQKAAELLDDRLQETDVNFYDYRNVINFERYQKLLEDGRVEQSNAFAVTFRQRGGVEERFTFRYYRNFNKFLARRSVIPLEVNFFDRTSQRYVRLSDGPLREKVRIRELYFAEDGEFILGYFNRDTGAEAERRCETIAEAVQQFFEDVLQNVLHLR
jgi:Fic family protein